MSTKLDTEVTIEVLFKSVFELFFNSWLLMLALHLLSGHLEIPRLAIGYWTAVLIVLLSIALIPQNYHNDAYLKRIMNMGEPDE